MADGWALPGELTDGGAAYPAPQLGEWRKKLFGTLFFVSIGFNYLLQRPFLMLVALHMALPWIAVALAALFPGDFTLSMTKKGAQRSGLALTWVFTPLSYLAVFNTTRLFSFERAVYLGCLAGAVFFLAVILVNARCRVSPSVKGLIALALFAAVYGYGLVRELNIELDRSQGAAYETTVLTKTHMRTNYGLHYAAWGPGNGEGSMAVARSLAHSVHEGDRVCMVVKQGALGMSWYTAQACPWNGKIEFP
jgi:hypothetical protein